MNFRKAVSLLAFAAVLAMPVLAQNRTRFGGQYNAVDYAYGIIGAPGPLVVQTGNSSTGSTSVTVQFAYTTLGDGTKLFPLVVGAPFTIGTGANSKNINYALQTTNANTDGTADNGNWANFTELAIQVVAGNTTNTGALSANFPLPPSCKRYIRGTATGEANGGNSSDSTFTVKLLF